MPLLFLFQWGYLYNHVVHQHISWIRLLLVPFIGYFQWEQASETLNKESPCSLKIKASIDFVLELKHFSEGPQILKCLGMELSTWNWSTGPTSTAEALKLKAMCRNLQRPETRLRWSPVVTPQKPSTPPQPSSPPLNNFSSALTPQNMAPAEMLMSEGENEHDKWREAGSKMKLSLKFEDTTVPAKLEVVCHVFIFICRSLKWQCNNHPQNKTLKISMQIENILLPATWLRKWPLLRISTVNCIFRLWWAMHDTLCTAAAETVLPCGAAMLLITLHVSGLPRRTHEPYGETNESVRHQLPSDFKLHAVR